MDMKTTLARIHAQLKAQNLTAAAVSRDATGSPDTIRNWERRAKSGKKAGVSTITLESVANVLGVPVDWLMGAGPDDLAQYNADASMREQMIKIFDHLPASLQAVALRQLSALAPEEAAAQRPDDPTEAD